MTRVLFHSLTIPPDNVSTGKLVADIANKFSENGQHIEILASTPQYNFDESVFNNELIQIKEKKDSIVAIVLNELIPVTQKIILKIFVKLHQDPQQK